MSILVHFKKFKSGILDNEFFHHNTYKVAMIKINNHIAFKIIIIAITMIF